MKTRNKILVSAAVATLMIPLAVNAADPPRCNELPNDAQRLGCYDAVFGKPVGAGAQAARVAPVAPAAGAPAAPLFLLQWELQRLQATAVAAAAVPAACAAPAAAQARRETGSLQVVHHVAGQCSRRAVHCDAGKR